jgi:hypothetical protein
MNRHRLERLLEARSIEEMPADDGEVAAIWEAALREWSDSAVTGLSVAGAFVHVYQAGFRAAAAVVRAAGYRPRSAVGGHHYLTFYAAAALGDETIERGADMLQDIRGDRHLALYGADDELDPEELGRARARVGEFLGSVHGWLAAQRPALTSRLRRPVPA